MTKFLRLALMAAAVVALAALAAGCGSKKKASSSTTTTTSSSSSGAVVGSGSFSSGSPAKGGTYTVGWEGSFGFTNNFDPTGEYLGNAWGLYSNLMLRALVGYKHQPGAAGNDTVGDLATEAPNADRQRPHLHLQAPQRREVRAAGEPRSHVEGRRLRHEPARQPERRRRVLLLLHGDQGLGRRRKRHGEDRLRHRDAGRLDDRLPPDEGSRRLQPPHVDAGDGTDPGGSRQVLRGKPGDYGRDLVSSGPYMLQGADKVTATCPMKAMSGYDGANGNHIILVRNPNYDQSTDPYRKNYIDTFKFVVNSNADDIFAKVQSGAYQDEVSSPAPKTVRAYATNSVAQAADDPERRRPHQLHHDEPHAGSVRRHPRSQGDELDHRQGSPAEGVGRPDPGLDRHTHRAAGALQQRSRRVRPVLDAGQRGRPGEGTGRDEAVEVRPRQDRQVHGVGLQGRPADLGCTERGQDDGPDPSGRRGQDRHQVHGSDDQRGVSDAPEALQQRADL